VLKKPLNQLLRKYPSKDGRYFACADVIAIGFQMPLWIHCGSESHPGVCDTLQNFFPLISSVRDLSPPTLHNLVC